MKGVALGLMCLSASSTAYDFMGPVVAPRRGENATVESMAAHYDAPACRAAIAASWRRYRWNATCPRFSSQQALVLSLSGRRSVWVRDQKAASRMLWNDLTVITGANASKVRVPYGHASGFARYAAPDAFVPEDGDFVWTTIREPAAKALSGYAEILLKKTTNKLAIPWAVKDGAHTRNFANFLEVLATAANLGDEAMHAWPMAILLDVVPRRGARRYDAMARVENLDDELRRILALAGAQSFNEVAMEEFRHSHAKKKTTTKVTPGHTHLMRLFCKLSQVDYVCFPAYSPPRACVDADPNFLRRWHRRGTADHAAAPAGGGGGRERS